jgi:hypothetical protein
VEERIIPDFEPLGQSLSIEAPQATGRVREARLMGYGG